SNSLAAPGPAAAGSIFPPARLFFAIVSPHPLVLARRRLVKFANTAAEIRSNRATGREADRVLFARDADRSPPRAIVARALCDLCSPTPVPTLPSAFPNPR